MTHGGQPEPAPVRRARPGFRPIPAHRHPRAASLNVAPVFQPSSCPEWRIVRLAPSVLATGCDHHHQGADDLSGESRFAYSMRPASGDHLPARIGDCRRALRDACRGVSARAQVAAAPHAMERGARSHRLEIKRRTTRDAELAERSLLVDRAADHPEGPSNVA